MEQLKRHTIAILAVLSLVLALHGLPAAAGPNHQGRCASACPDCAEPASAICVACAGVCLNTTNQSSTSIFAVSPEVALLVFANFAVTGFDTAPPVPPPRRAS